MLRRLDEGIGNTLGYEVTGKLTQKEFETLSEEFKAVVAEHGKVRLLVRMCLRYLGWSSALWQKT